MADFRQKMHLARLLLTLWASVSTTPTHGSRSKTRTHCPQNSRSKITAGAAAALISTLFVVAAVGPVNTAANAAPTSTAQAQA
jgi:hypothetical protein